MSDTIKSSTGTKVLRIPQTFIGAQELLNIASCSYSGFLSKRGRRERLVERLNLPKAAIFNNIKKWRKRFVIISQGCVYMYDTNSSSRPHQAFPLAEYNRLYMMGSDYGALTFRLEGRYDRMKQYHFSCATENDRKEWMARLREEMCLANDKESENKPTSVASMPEEDAYNYLQKPIFEDDVSSECGSFDSDYDQINDKVVPARTRMPLPPTPEELTKRTSTSEKPKVPKPEQKSKVPKPEQKSKRPIPKPPVETNDVEVRHFDRIAPTIPKVHSTAKAPPKSGNKLNNRHGSGIQEIDYMFDSNDRDEAARVLTAGPEGTFLVRTSRNDDSKVLAVKNGQYVREYKVFKQEGQVSIDKQNFHNSMRELLKYYMSNNLPKRDISLGKAYSYIDLSAI